MFQRIILTLKEKKLLVPAGIILALLVVLSLIIILGQFFHQSLQEEMANEFNKQQLLLARQVAMNIESFTDNVFKSIRVIAQLPDIDRVDVSPQCRSAVESISFSLRNEAMVTIRVLDKKGVLLYDSSFPGRERVDMAATVFFQKARLLPKNEKFVSDLLPTATDKSDQRQFVIATPIYQRRNNSPVSEFRGVVLAVLSLTA
jgi:hypothetical protein